MTKTVPALAGMVALSFGLSAGFGGGADPGPKTERAIPPAPERWAQDGPGGAPGFTRHVQPLLAKMGCSNRACHGSFQGQGGFRLSLFGSDPKFDHEALTRDPKSQRVDLQDPEESLALLKATKQTSHKGGERFKPDSWQYRMFKEWIAAGAVYQPGKEPVLERLEIIPSQIVFAKGGDRAQLRVLAHYSDQTVEEVTSLTQFSTNDDMVAAVTDAGLITANKNGDTAVVATFGGAVGTAHVLVPLPSRGAIAFQPNNRIDELVAAKWAKLGLRPSGPATDAEFLRRASLDAIGTLPTAEEVRRFLDSKDPHKRQAKIDELLSRPEYAEFWATRFSDLTGNDDRFLPQPRIKTVWLWYAWLKDKLQKNLPYDQLVEGILTATSRDGMTAEEYAEHHKKLVAEMDAGYVSPTYAARRTNDLFWKKTGNRGEQVALQISYAFLGIRLECAQCHKHPFDRWTQDDFKGYAAFFTPVRLGVPPDADKTVSTAARGNNQAFQYNEVFINLPPPERVGNVKGVRPKDNRQDALRGPKPRALGGSEYPLEPGKDPRVALMEWLRAPDNPFFAKAIVNRIWTHYFSVGIVNPSDDMNAANPPSNPELLDWLARDFIDHGFDLKHLHRTILNSAVYQLSWEPNETNGLDRRNFSHALLRRLPAEVVVDAIDQATGATPRYGNLAPPGTRAIGLAPARLGNQGSAYALAIFGRPLRTQTCDCERSADAGLPQAMYLLNDSDVNLKIMAPAGRLSRLLSEIGDNAKLVNELYLSTVSRYPTPEELEKSLAHVDRAATRKAGFEDVLWSLLNLREFVFNH